MDTSIIIYSAHLPIIGMLGYIYYKKVGEPFLTNMNNMCKYPYYEEEDNMLTDLRERIEALETQDRDMSKYTQEIDKVKLRLTSLEEVEPSEYILTESDK